MRLTSSSAVITPLMRSIHAKTVAEPAWSQQEGHWAKATAEGVVDGTSPERPMKRDEVIAVLGRKGLL